MLFKLILIFFFTYIYNTTIKKNLKQTLIFLNYYMYVIVHIGILKVKSRSMFIKIEFIFIHILLFKNIIKLTITEKLKYIYKFVV